MIKLVIPVILAAIIVVAGIFAFMPVEQASTIHNTISSGGQVQFLELEKTLPVNRDDVSWTFTTDANNGAIITAIWVDNTSTLSDHIVVTCSDVQGVVPCPAPDVDFSPDCTNGIFDIDISTINFSVDCPDANFRLQEWKVNDALLFSSEKCLNIQITNKFDIRNLHRQFSQKCGESFGTILKPIFTNPDSIYLPITKGNFMELTFDTSNGSNDIELNVIIAFQGGANAVLR